MCEKDRVVDRASPMRSGDGRPTGGKGVPGGLLAVMSVAGVVLVLLGTCRYGIGISADSASHLCAARSLLAGRGYWALCNTPYSAWPPLYPTLLAAFGLAGIDPADGARVLNAFAMGGIVFVSGVFLGRCLRSRLLATLGTCSVLLSFPLLGISSMAWTEPVFVLLIVLFVWRMSAFLRDRNALSLVAAAVLAALCALQRYPGVTIIAAGAALILWAGSGIGFGNRLRQLAAFITISCTPLGLWMLRDYRLTGMLTGHARQHSIYSLRENITAAADTAMLWIMPQSIHSAVRAGILGVLIVVLVGAIVLVRRKIGRNAIGDRECLWTAALVALVYIPLILYTHQVGVLDEPMNDRYLAPLAVMVPWFLFLGVDSIVALLRLYPRRGSVIAPVVIASCALWLIYPLARTGVMIQDQMRHGAGGYSVAAWQESPLAGWLGSHRPQGTMRSNAPGAFYALTGVDALVSPHRTWDIPAFREMVSSGGGETLVWFKNSAASYLYDLDELVSLLPIEEIASLPDGGVYRLGGPQGQAGGRMGPFSPRMVNGVRHLRFTSETFGPRGLIRSWVMREDGTTDSVWELHAADGQVITWSPSCGYARSGDAFEFRCEGRADCTSTSNSSSYKMFVRGTMEDDVAAGEYRIEFSGAPWPAVDKGWWRVDVARPVRRLYAPRRGIHAYTMSREETLGLAGQSGASWLSEGVVFCVYPEGSQPPDALPVWRFSSKASGADFYTISTAERDGVMANPAPWEYKGVAWYAYAPERHPLGAVAVHRFWSDASASHFYTVDEREKETLRSRSSQTWAYEGVVWYALPAEGP